MVEVIWQMCGHSMDDSLAIPMMSRNGDMVMLPTAEDSRGL